MGQDMGIFDVPFPVFDWLDGALRGILPPLAAIVFWGVLGAIVSMALYQVFSRQALLARVSAEAAAGRWALIRYDGEFAGFLALTRKTLGLSFRQLRLALGPALPASIPLISLLAWLSQAYGYGFAAPGATLAVRIHPPEAAVTWEPPATRAGDRTAWQVVWPPEGQRVRLLDGGGREVFALPPAAPVTVIHKRRWWNLLLGNPIGYLPDDGGLDRVEMELPALAYHDIGPGWMRDWEAAFFAALLLCSLAIKFAFRIR